MHYTLITDASHCTETCWSGSAALIIGPDGEEVQFSKYRFKAENSTDAEKLAMIRGLEQVPKRCFLTVLSDCEGTVNAINHVLLGTAKERHKRIAKGLTTAVNKKQFQGIDFMWVKGHDKDNPDHQRVDKAARMAMKAARMKAQQKRAQ